ncbi:SDR family oxidoreductase [Candidatus Woesearchaeota archaeon]|nr:SDR family oxidoreductase [Candidatus Woesearchaeota archaeon]
MAGKNVAGNLESVVVVGGASGIGEATSRLFAEKGYNAIIGDFDRMRGQRVSQHLANSSYCHVDVASEASMRAFAGYVGENGGIDHLVHTPGGPSGEELLAEQGKKHPKTNAKIHPITGLSPDAVYATIELNFLGYERAVKHLTPLMLKRRGRDHSICGITSINNSKSPKFSKIQKVIYYTRKSRNISIINEICYKFGKYGLPIYSAMKAAVEAYSVVAANKLGPRVRVNTVAPGSTYTPATIKEKMNFKAVAQKTGLQRVTLPEDIAKEVYSMATNPAVSGQSRVVDSLQFLAEDRSRYQRKKKKEASKK